MGQHIQNLDTNFVLTAPNGSTWEMSINNSGVWTSTQLTPPLSIPLSGLRVWFDADAASTICVNDNGTGGTPIDGGTVGSWLDQSGNNNNIAQSTSGSRPTYVLNSVNGLPAIVFDGSDDFLVSQTFTWSRPETVFVVVNRIASTGTIFDGISVNGGRLFNDSGTNIRIYAGDYGATTNLTNGSYAIIKVVIDANANSITINNGSPVTNSTPMSANMSGLTLAAVGTGGNYCQCEIAEFVGYDRILTSGEENIVWSYLSDKYAISI